MKRIISGFILSVLVLSACKRNHDCECVTKDGSGKVTSTVTVTVRATKRQAENACSSQATASSGGTSITQTCKIK